MTEGQALKIHYSFNSVVSIILRASSVRFVCENLISNLETSYQFPSVLIMSVCASKSLKMKAKARYNRWDSFHIKKLKFDCTKWSCLPMPNKKKLKLKKY